MKRFERYVLAEILPLLVGALASVIVLFVLAALQEVIAPLLAKGARPLLVARVLALNVPEAAARALPIALMFATLLGLSRLSSDSELKAALASGIPARRLYRPVLLLGLGVTVLAFLIGEGLLPRTKIEERKVKQEIVFDNPRVIGLGAQEPGGQSLVLRDALGRAISVGEVRAGGELRDLRIVTMQGGSVPREVITAREGRLKSGSNVLELQGGQRVTYQDGRPVTILSFERGTLPVQDVQADLDTGGKALKANYLPLRELLARTNSYRQQHIQAPAEFTALHQKFAEPLAALALAFFAVSLAVFTFQSGRDLGLVWALLLAFAYYATWSVFRIMGENGAIPGVLAAYAPDLIAVVAGAVLLKLAGRR
ncbi:LptF/LptG family permease [Deinococcus deserti]|uniref:Putative membrane protein putative permease n=1 Tax=Deinococcus deserti (strain DSM 17065 / CIP 109153 / LMG 22923 / VCD115) TaxID=546414 RepID=C1D091_DEIDV|nr:LptF/LptG family permease [Deinococcus deserti]ACO47360.1 putative membrane protein; putative permease [Deinococcus deserti VCD115]